MIMAVNPVISSPAVTGHCCHQQFTLLPSKSWRGVLCYCIPSIPWYTGILVYNKCAQLF
jgi:hypothetical protein